jgi:hypothetical protein
VIEPGVSCPVCGVTITPSDERRPGGAHYATALTWCRKHERHECAACAILHEAHLIENPLPAASVGVGLVLIAFNAGMWALGPQLPAIGRIGQAVAIVLGALLVVLGATADRR